MKNPKYLSRTAWVFVTAACLSLSAGSSIGAALTGDYLGKTEAEIAQNLAEKGYEVDEFEKEHGLIEAGAAIDGVSYEIHVDPKTGEIVTIEVDD